MNFKIIANNNDFSLEIKNDNNKEIVINLKNEDIKCHQSITLNDLTETELRDLDAAINRIWYEQDVINYINQHDMVFHEDTIHDITNDYAYLRQKNDGDAEGMTWEDCLNTVFENYPYGDECSPTMINTLFQKLMNAKTIDDLPYLPNTDENYIKLILTDSDYTKTNFWQSYITGMQHTNPEQLLDIYIDMDDSLEDEES